MDMKTSIATLLMAFAVLTNISAERGFPPAVIQECTTKEGITLEEAHEVANKGNLTLAETNPNVKCFLGCILKAGNLIDGCNLIYVEMKGENPNTFRNQGLNFCKDKVKSNEPCQCGYELFKCMIEY